MKKVLFIIWSYSLGGGAESLLTMIVNHLDPQKYQTGIIEFYHSTVKKEPVNPDVMIYDPITFEGDREYQKKLYYVHREPEKMIRRYIPAGYDLYVSFNYQIPSFLLPEGSRNIAWIHGVVHDLAETGMEAYCKLQDRAFERAAKIVAISDMTADSIRTLFPDHADKVVKIYNALDIRRVREKADQPAEIKLEHPSLISVGRLDDNKDPMRMLDIFRRLASGRQSLHLYFLGKGQLEGQILGKISEYGLQERVHLLGYAENPFPVMKQADVCCMTSRSEGFGMVLLESIALQVPFVSTRVGGAVMIADGERCGRTFQTDEEAAELIAELLDTPRDVIRRECERSAGRFDLDTYISKIEELFDSVLEGKAISEEWPGWNSADSMEILEDRDYYYRFPEGLLPGGSKVILYGAGDIGTNYYHYIKERGICQVAAWVDAAAEKYRVIGRDVKDVETISRMEYDAVLIAVMNERTAEAIRRELEKRGIPNSKILWTRPVF